MKRNRRASWLLGLALVITIIGCVAPAEDLPLAELLGSFARSSSSVGGEEVSGPISIRDSIIGDIISISVNVNSTIRTNVSIELLQTVVCALNEYGDYGIEMDDVRKALSRWYVARTNAAPGKR
uniref:Uncharacterized protein n=1 Tax=Anopheles minimus TaxID=112268 RepID=A0A182W2Q2_9DIPT